MLFFYGFVSGFVFVILALAGLGIYARHEQERMVRFFVRRSLNSAMAKAPRKQ